MARRKVPRGAGRKRTNVRLQSSPTRPSRKISILLGAVALCAVAVALGIAVRLQTTRSPLPLAEPTLPVATSPVPASPPSTPTSVLPPFPTLSLDSALAPEEQDRALREEQLEAARRLAAAFPGDSNASFLLGMAYLEQGNAVEATAHLSKALELQPARADAYDHLGQIALLAGEYERASEMFRKALELDPKTPNAHFRLARALAFLGQSEEAIAEAQKDIESSPQAGESYALLGETYAQLQDYANAKIAYEKAVEVQPKLSKPYYGLSVVCARLGQQEQSQAYQQKFRDIEAQDRQAGRHWRQVFDPLAITRRSVAHTHVDVGRVYQSHGRADLAEPLWQKAALLDPNNVDCRFYLGALCEQKQKPLDALKLYEQITRAEPGNGAAYFLTGNLRMRLNQPDEAEKAFRKVVEVSPERPEGYRALAQLYLRLNRNPTEARALAARATEIEPVAANYSLLAAACEKNNDRAGALAAIKRAVELDPGNSEYQRAYQRLMGTR
jgi:tetratricopeptide (TPR) repeat protein